MSYVYKGNTDGLLYVLQLVLHVLAKLQVESTERLVQKKHLGMRNKRARNSNTLLLTARKGTDALVLKADESDHLQHLGNLLAYLLLGELLQPEREGNVLIHVQVREQRVFLENGIDMSFVRGNVADLDTVEIELALVSGLKAADYTECRRLAAAGRAEKGHELTVSYIKVHRVYDTLSVVGF